MNRLVMAALLAGAAIGAGAADQGRIVSGEQLNGRAATLTVFVPPKYPRGALGDNVQATLDVFGRIGTDGVLQVSKVESTSDIDEFKAAVEQVVPLWRLRPDFGEDCVPRPTEGQVRVWFDIREGKPVIRFSQTPRAKPAPMPEPAIRVARRTRIEYPSEAGRRNLETVLETILRIGAEGDVQAVHVVPGLYSEHFEREITRSLRNWRFEPSPGRAPTCVTYDVEFRFSRL